MLLEGKQKRSMLSDKNDKQVGSLNMAILILGPPCWKTISEALEEWVPQIIHIYKRFLNCNINTCVSSLLRITLTHSSRPPLYSWVASIASGTFKFSLTSWWLAASSAYIRLPSRIPSANTLISEWGNVSDLGLHFKIQISLINSLRQFKNIVYQPEHSLCGFRLHLRSQSGCTLGFRSTSTVRRWTAKSPPRTTTIRLHYRYFRTRQLGRMVIRVCCSVSTRLERKLLFHPQSDELQDAAYFEFET